VKFSGRLYFTFIEKFNQGEAIFNLTEELTSQYESGRINEIFLKAHITDVTKRFSVCGA
jgi:hypothetical protein